MLEWPDSTLFEAVSAVAEQRPGAAAVVFDGETCSFRELRDRALAFGAGLDGEGIGEGDRIAVWLANRPAWLAVQLGASLVGASVVAVNTRYRSHELEYVLRDSGARLLVTEHTFLDRDYLELVSELVPAVRSGDPGGLDADAVPALESVVSVEPAPGYAGVSTLETFAGDADAAPAPTGDGETPCVIFYTSGTTGDPKGCVHDNRSVLNHSYNVGAHFDVTPDDVGLGAIPFCGSFGYNVWLSCLSRGVPLVVQAHFDPGEAVDLIDRHDVTYASGTAQLFLRAIDHEAFAPERVESLRRGAIFFANGFNESDFERLESALGFPICQPYGLSEANTQLFVGDPDAPADRRKTVGGPLIHEALEARIVDPDTREVLADGERGELALRGYNVMQEYLGKPEATAAVLDDEGWLYTGDLCERGGDDIAFHSRLDDALRVRGFLVSPRAIERAVEGHPAVDLAQVVGAPHPRHGQVPVAFVRGDATSAEALRASLAERIADYKVPEDVVFVAEFPRTEGPHGEKVQKNVLRERVVDRY